VLEALAQGPEGPLRGAVEAAVDDRLGERGADAGEDDVGAEQADRGGQVAEGAGAGGVDHVAAGEVEDDVAPAVALDGGEQALGDLADALGG